MTCRFKLFFIHILLFLYAVSGENHRNLTVLYASPVWIDSPFDSLSSIFIILFSGYGL